MATNYVQEGKVLDFTAPYDRTTGQGFQVGSIFAVALGTALSGAAIRGQVNGVWTLAKTSAQAWTVGQKIYWDNTNKRCDSDSTVGMLIGVAAAVAANPSSTGTVRLNGVSPATAEGPQAAEADLTDNSGGAAADGTIGAVTAPAAITDNSGGVDPGDDTIAVVTGAAAITDNSGGVDPGDNTIAVVTGAAAITDNSGGVDPGDNTIALVTNAANAGSADIAPTTAAIAQLAAKQNTTSTAVTASKAAIAQLAAKQNTTSTAVTAIKAAVAQLAAKQNVDRTAIVALTDAIKELSTKQNAVLAKLRIAGIISS